MNNPNANKEKFLITIAGPTAVGKTDLTLFLASKYDSAIFSADSRQLYKEITIGTAKPSQEELDRIQHHFINHVSIHDSYNAGKYEREINQLFKTYFSSNNIGILTGGTGMYIKAVLEGLDDFPEVNESDILHLENRLKEKGINELVKELQEQDPIYAQQVDLSNARRLIRALSVIRVSGKPYSSFLNKKKVKPLPFTPIKICLTRNRDELYLRINRRVDQMMDTGLLDEVKGLKEYQDLKSMQTVGYSELFKYLNGEIELTEAVELIKRNSRRYAKRQMTWFRNQGEWAYFDADDTNAIIHFIDSKLDLF